MNLKTVAFILIALALALIVYWAATGAETYTLQQVPIKTVDSLFGTESVAWKDEYRPGLVDRIGPVAGALLVISAVLFWLAARRKRNAVA